MTTAIGTFNDLIFYSTDKQPFSYGDELIFTHTGDRQYRLIFQHAMFYYFMLRDERQTLYQANLKDPTLEKITHVATGRIYTRN